MVFQLTLSLVSLGFLIWGIVAVVNYFGAKADAGEDVIEEVAEDIGKASRKISDSFKKGFGTDTLVVDVDTLEVKNVN